MKNWMVDTVVEVVAKAGRCRGRVVGSTGGAVLVKVTALVLPPSGVAESWFCGRTLDRVDTSGVVLPVRADALVAVEETDW